MKVSGCFRSNFQNGQQQLINILITLNAIIVRKIFCALIFVLFFSGISCRSKNDIQGKKETVSSDSIFTDRLSGILLAKNYTNKEDGYSINYPSNWNIYEYKNTGGIDFFGHFETPAGNDDMSDLGIAIYERDKSETLDEFCQGYIAKMKASDLMSDITLEKNLSFTYQDNYNAYSFLFTAKSLGTFDTRVHMFIEKGNKIYHLRGLLSPKYPTESLQLYFEIMTTIQFLE